MWAYIYARGSKRVKYEPKTIFVVAFVIYFNGKYTQLFLKNLASFRLYLKLSESAIALYLGLTTHFP